MKIHSLTFIFCFSFLFFSQCKEKSACEVHPLNQEKSTFNFIQLITRTTNGMAILMESDGSGDGQIDDWLWVKGDLSKPNEAILLFNEIQDGKGFIVEQIYYGDKNHKLMGKSDLDKDGFLESTIYYNFLAKPKVIQGIVARVEIDGDKNGSPEIWIYPGLRIEYDGNRDGIPEWVSEDLEIIQQVYENFQKMKDTILSMKPLPKEKSLVLHPELISTEKHKAVIPRSY